MTNVRAVLLTVALCSLVSGVVVAGYDRFHRREPVIATVDINGLVRDFVVQTAKSANSGKLDEAEITRQTKVFSDNLDSAAQSVANDYHLLLLTKAAVVGGAVDVTPLVRQRVAGGGHGAN